MRLIDSHCHLQADRFDDDVDAVIAAAREAGVERILVPGWNPWSCAAALELVERVPWLDAAVGVHPHDAAKVSDDEWATIAASARDRRVLAIGETGLDYDRVFSPIGAQLANLGRNLELAVELDKPVILHCRSRAGERNAQDALLDVVRAFGGAVRPVIHSFSGPVDYAEAMLELGAAISISGLAFRRGEEATADVVRLVPADRLLVETDSPFLSPPGGPRGRNTPEWVRVTANWVAELRGDDPDVFGDGLVDAYQCAFGAGSGNHVSQSAAYAEFVEASSAALYRIDPFGMGRSIGAPEDEYEDEAARLATSVLRSQSVQEVSEEVSKRFGADPHLIEAIVKAWTRYRSEPVDAP